MKVKSIVRAATGILAAFCMMSNSAEAIFASVKSTGMAATAIAYPQDTLAGAYNPAGMIWVGDRVDIEGGFLHDRGNGKITNSAVTSPYNFNQSVNGMRTGWTPFADGGINKTFCDNCDFVDFSIGLIVYNRNYQKTTYKKKLFLLSSTHRPGVEYVHETIAPTFAVSFKDCWGHCHSLGIAVNYQLQRFKADGIQNLAQFSESPGSFTNNGYAYSRGITPTIGYMGYITDCISIGLTYQPRTHMSRLHKYKGLLAERGRLDIPEKVGAGIAMDLCTNWTVCFDYEWIHWSEVHSISNDLHFPPPPLLGQDGATGFGFQNQNYYRLGVEWRYSPCMTWRAGFRHANCPIKKSQTAVNLLTLDTVENFLTFGGTWKACECQELSFFLAYGFENSVNGHNAIPPQLGGGNVKLKEQKWGFGLAWGYDY